MNETTLVLRGATRCHLVDTVLTEYAAELKKLAVKYLRACHAAWGRPDWEREDERLSSRLDELGRPGGAWFYAHRLEAWRGPKDSIPRCNMVAPGPALRFADAGQALAQECEKALDFPHRIRVDITGARRAYVHAMECAICQFEGVGRCEVFLKLGTREIESELDPRLDPDFAKASADGR